MPKLHFAKLYQTSVIALFLLDAFERQGKFYFLFFKERLTSQKITSASEDRSDPRREITGRSDLSGTVKNGAECIGILRPNVTSSGLILVTQAYYGFRCSRN